MAMTATRLRAPARISRQQKLASWCAALVALLLGLGTSFAVHFVGDLYLAEILMLLIFPILLLLRGRRALQPNLKTLYIFMGFWLIGQIVSDAYNHTNTVDRMRGVAAIVFFAIDLVGISILFKGNDRRKVLFLVGLMVGALASVILQPSPAVADYPWKFGYAWGTIQLVLLICVYFYGRRRYVIAALLILGLCVVNLVTNFRSPVLILLVTMTLVFPIVPERLGGLRVLPRSQGWRLVVLASFALVAAGIAGKAVNFVTQAGYIDEAAREKNESQAKAGNLILGGRPDFAIGLQAALDRPIVGHGSWAKDPKYYEMLYDSLVESGVQGEQDTGDILEDEGNPLIPSHSHIIGSWVWAGVSGLAFWIYVIWFLCRGVARVAMLRPSLAPAYMWMMIGMYWDIFFSPFAANRRIVEAFLLFVIADMLGSKGSAGNSGWKRFQNPRRPPASYPLPIQRPSRYLR